MKKKFLLALSLVAIFIVIFAISISAAEPVEVWDISATENDSVTAYLYADPENSEMYTLTISGTGDMKNWLYDYVPWYSSYGSKIASVTIEAGVTSIGDYAFSSCTSLTSINIPESVTSIGDMAFYFCSALTNVVIPESVTSIGDSAFYYCYNLTSIVIPESVTYIGDRAFGSCYKLTSIDIPESVTYIGDSAFYDCFNLTSVVIPKSVTYIGNYAFYECKSLTSINIPESVTSIGDRAFGSCYKLTSIDIPESVTYIGNSAFASCYRLTSIDIPESVTHIGDSAFYYCNSLTSIDIPESVTSIGNGAFYRCSNLTIYAETESQPSGWYTSWNSSGCPVVWDYKNTIKNDVFTFKGYSFGAEGQIAFGFDIDYEAKALYEKLTGDMLEMGVVFAGYDNLCGAQPLDENGTPISLESGKVLKADLTEMEFYHYNFILTDVLESARDIKLVIAAYIYDGEVVKYTQENGLCDTVSGISYNEAKESTI